MRQKTGKSFQVDICRSKKFLPQFEAFREGNLNSCFNLLLSTKTACQGFKIKKKTKTPRITDEGWNSQKRLSDPVEKKMKEGKRRKKRLLYLHLKLSLGLVPL